MQQAATVTYYTDNGFPAEKIVLGMGAYGRSWTLASASSNGVGASATGAGVQGTMTREGGYLGYYEVCSHSNHSNY